MIQRLLNRLARSPRTAWLARLAMTGDRVECPCCGARFRSFRPYNGPDRICWSCGSMERHRALWLYLDRHPDMTRRGISVLHVAPEPILSRRLRGIPGVSYRGGDLTAEFGPERIDVTQLQFEDASFDAVVCNHVLEHVPDDRLAMRELARVLRPDGWALLQVPDVDAPVTDEDPAVTDPDERKRRFGQADHVRRYGWDYVERLQQAGFAVEVASPDQFLPEERIERFRLRKFGELEPIFVCGAA
jgi:SAM-dependent methyltransferase